MTPVFQTIVSPKKGNCMQAAFASLFDLKLEEVPNFIEFKNIDWFAQVYNFIKSQGHQYYGVWSNPKDLGSWGDDHFKSLKDEPGVNGYFYAAVNSPKFFNAKKYVTYGEHSPTHAVIIDRECNIVHDPNPAYKDIKQYPLHEYLGYNGVLYVYLIEKL